MIADQELLTRLKEKSKIDRDLIRYIYYGLLAYDKNYEEIFPLIWSLNEERRRLREFIDACLEEIQEHGKNHHEHLVNLDKVPKLSELHPWGDLDLQHEAWSEAVEAFIAANPVVWSEDVGAYIAANPQSGKTKDNSYDGNSSIEGPDDEYLLIDEIKLNKNRYDIVTALRERLFERKGTGIEFKEFIHLLSPTNLAKLDSNVITLRYKENELMDHINRDLNIEQPSEVYIGREQIIKQFQRRCGVNSWSRIKEILKEKKHTLRTIKLGKKDKPKMDDKDFNDLGFRTL